MSSNPFQFNAVCTSCNEQEVELIKGEYICCACGVVNCFDNLDDSYETNNPFRCEYEGHFLDLHSKHTKMFRVGAVQRDPLAQDIIFATGILNKLLIDEQFVSTWSDWYKLGYSKTKRLKKRAFFAGCSYCVSIFLNRGYDILFFSSHFQIEVSNVWKAIYKLSNKWKSQMWYTTLMTKFSSPEFKIRRIVYEIPFVPENKEIKIINAAKNIFEKIRDSITLSSSKTKTIYLTCVFIGCCVNKLDISRGGFCQACGISLPSLNQTESRIQDALRSLSS